jgi:hypothetical protein
MATDTPNFNWPIPEDTDLVKDGAKAIRDLGNAIDTSAQDFGGGLVHIETVTTGGNVTSFSVNDVFSSTYDNYKIIMYGTGVSGTSCDMRLRVSGADESGTNYQRQEFFANGTSVSAARATNQSGMRVATFDTTQNVNIFEISAPFLAKRTSGIRLGGYRIATNIELLNGYNGHTLETSYTGFTLLGVDQQINLTISVYGYAKA